MQRRTKTLLILLSILILGYSALPSAENTSQIKRENRAPYPNCFALDDGSFLQQVGDVTFELFTLDQSNKKIHNGYLELPEIGQNIISVVFRKNKAILITMYDGLKILKHKKNDNWTIIKSFYIPGKIRTFTEKDGLLFLGSENNEIHIVNINDAENPVLMNTISTLHTFDKITVAGDYLFGATIDAVNDMIVIDIHDVKNPKVVTAINRFRRTYEFVPLNDSTIIIGGDYGMYSLNIKNPGKPEIITGFYSYGSNPMDIYESNGYYYATILDYRILVFKETENNKLELISELYFEEAVSEIVVKNNYAYIGYKGGLLVVNVENPAAPKIVHKHPVEGFAKDVYIENDLLYVAGSDIGLLIFDISQPDSPQMITSYEKFNDVQDVDARGEYVFVVDYDAGLFVFKFENRSNLKLIGRAIEVELGYGIQIVSDFVIIKSDHGIYSVDIAQPDSPNVVRFLENDDLFNSAKLSSINDQKIEFPQNLVAHQANIKTVVLDFTDPKNPVLKRQYGDKEIMQCNRIFNDKLFSLGSEIHGYDLFTNEPTTMTPEIHKTKIFDLVKNGNYIYAAANHDGIVTFEVNQSGGFIYKNTCVLPDTSYEVLTGDHSPDALGVAAKSTPAHQLAISDKFGLIGAYGEDKMYVMDISRPAHPEIIQSIPNEFFTPGFQRAPQGKFWIYGFPIDCSLKQLEINSELSLKETCITISEVARFLKKIDKDIFIKVNDQIYVYNILNRKTPFLKAVIELENVEDILKMGDANEYVAVCRGQDSKKHLFVIDSKYKTATEPDLEVETNYQITIHDSAAHYIATDENIVRLNLTDFSADSIGLKGRRGLNYESKIMTYDNLYYLNERQYVHVMHDSAVDYLTTISKINVPGDVERLKHFTISDNKLYLLCRSSEIAVFDISPEKEPTLIEKTYFPYSLRKIFIHGNYGIFHSGLKAYYVKSDGFDYKILNEFAFGKTIRAAHLTDKYAYILTDYEITIADLKSEGDTVATMSIKSKDWIEDIAVQNDLIITLEEKAIRIFRHLQDGAVEQLVHFPVAYRARNFIVDGNYIYLKKGFKQLVRIDISDPAAPGEIVKSLTSGDNLFKLYMDDAQSRLAEAYFRGDDATLNFYNPKNLELVQNSKISISTDPEQIAIANGKLILLDTSEGLMFYDLSQPDTIVQSAKFWSIGEIEHVEIFKDQKTLCVITKMPNRIFLYDLQKGSKEPVLINSFEIDGSFLNISEKEGTIYLTSKNEIFQLKIRSN